MIIATTANIVKAATTGITAIIAVHNRRLPIFYAKVRKFLFKSRKEPIARKGARITSHIALPGRFLVYMPTIEHLGVSRKIESSNERGRLRTLIQSIKREEDVPTGGFIVRTAGVGISDEDLRQDARYLVRTWQDIKKASEKKKSPALVHQDLDIIQRILRDQLSDEFAAIRVDSEEEYLRIVEFINRIQPRMVNRVKLSRVSNRFSKPTAFREIDKSSETACMAEIGRLSRDQSNGGVGCSGKGTIPENLSARQCAA